MLSLSVSVCLSVPTFQLLKQWPIFTKLSSKSMPLAATKHQSFWLPKLGNNYMRGRLTVGVGTVLLTLTVLVITSVYDIAVLNINP